VSGSDDGRLFIWERASGNVVLVAQADSRILNCVQPHPCVRLRSETPAETGGHNLLDFVDVDLLHLHPRCMG